MTSAVSFILFWVSDTAIDQRKIRLRGCAVFQFYFRTILRDTKNQFHIILTLQSTNEKFALPMHWAIESTGIGIIYVHRPVLEQKFSNNYCEYLQFQNWAAVIAAILYQSICLNFNHYCCSLYHWPLFYCI